MNGPEVTKEFVAGHLDMWISIYFQSKADRDKYTLGEYLAEILPEVGNTFALEWLNRLNSGGDKPEKRPHGYPGAGLGCS